MKSKKKTGQVYIKDLEKYSNQWVALDKDQTKVLSSGKTFQQVEKNVSQTAKVKDVVFMRVPPLDASYAP